jgi:hypothetical protein
MAKNTQANVITAANTVTAQNDSQTVVTLLPNPADSYTAIPLVETPEQRAARQEANEAALAAKQSQFSQAIQLLAEAKDGFDKAGDENVAATVTAAKATLLLYQARVDGRATADEVNAKLGDVFGFQMKGAGNSQVRVDAGSPDASKTPFGKASDIRKRIVRAVDAKAFSNGEDVKFFDAIPDENVEECREAVAVLIDQMEGDELSIWSFYDGVSKAKREHMVKLDRAFDARHIAALVETLEGPDAVATLADDAVLMAAYRNLVSALAGIDATIAAGETE